MMNICVIDDEVEFLGIIEEEIKKTAQRIDAEISIHSFNSVKGINLQTEYDLFLLDIRMPGKNGFEIAEEIRKHNHGKIVFVTSIENYVFDSFSHYAYDFILKDRLSDHLLRVLQRYIQEEKTLIIPYHGRNVIIHSKNIEMIQVNRNTLSVYAKGHIFQMKKSLVRFLNESNMLEEYRFIQIHQSYIINLEKIKKVQNNRMTMECGETVYISRKYYATFRKRYYNNF